MSTLFHNPAAFAPLYTDLVAIKGTAQSGTFKACVFEDGLDDPLSEASICSGARSVVVLVPKVGEGGWNCADRPRVGDVATLLSWGGIEGVDGYTVKKVDDFGDAWQLHARGAKC